MADKLTSKRRSWNMSRIKGKNTKPELKLRSELFKSGARYRLNYKLFGKPDIVFPKNKVAVFVHGCFWHQHGCKDTYRPKSNTDFWNTKLDKNIERDKVVKSTLESEGWKIIYAWECEVNNNLTNLTEKIIKELD